LRGLGKCVPAKLAARHFRPGKIFRRRQLLPGGLGKYFHFSEKWLAKSQQNQGKHWFTPAQRRVNERYGVWPAQSRSSVSAKSARGFAPRKRKGAALTRRGNKKGGA
jgi:hypothetical protein